MKKLIFDFDGTLVDSMWVWGGAIITALDKHKIEYPENIVQILTPLGFAGSAKYFKEALGIKMSEDDIIAEIKKVAADAYSNDIVTKKFVKNALSNLKSEGFSLNILTASPHTLLDGCLKHNDIYELFDNAWSCDDFSTTKANPMIYNMAAERLGVTVKDCVFFDDNVNALACAKSSGMPVIGVFDESSADDTEKIKSISDGYIHDFSEIGKISSILI